MIEYHGRHTLINHRIDLFLASDNHRRLVIISQSIRSEYTTINSSTHKPIKNPHCLTVVLFVFSSETAKVVLMDEGSAEVK